MFKRQSIIAPAVKNQCTLDVCSITTQQKRPERAKTLLDMCIQRVRPIIKLHRALRPREDEVPFHASKVTPSRHAPRRICRAKTARGFFRFVLTCAKMVEKLCLNRKTVGKPLVRHNYALSALGPTSISFPSILPPPHTVAVSTL